MNVEDMIGHSFLNYHVEGLRFFKSTSKCTDVCEFSLVTIAENFNLKCFSCQAITTERSFSVKNNVCLNKLKKCYLEVLFSYNGNTFLKITSM